MAGAVRAVAGSSDLAGHEPLGRGARGRYCEVLDQAADFVGYAPVLVAIVSSLVANLHAIVSHEKTMVGLEGHSDLLREIVNQILEREVYKAVVLAR